MEWHGLVADGKNSRKKLYCRDWIGANGGFLFTQVSFLSRSTAWAACMDDGNQDSTYVNSEKLAENKTVTSGSLRT